MTDAPMVRVDDKGYLLQQAMHKDCLKHEIDLSKYEWLKDIRQRWNRDKELETMFKNREWDKLEQIEEEYALHKLFIYVEPKEGDRVFYYDDIRPLSGTAGYVLFRDGFVFTRHVTTRS